jgi:hypothetical protein
MHRILPLALAGVLGLGLFLVSRPLASQEPARAQPKPKLDVPFVPTPQDVVDKMLELAGVTKNEVFLLVW